MALDTTLAKVKARRQELWQQNPGLKADIEALLNAQETNLAVWMEKAAQTLTQKGCDVIQVPTLDKAGEVVESLIRQGTVVQAYTPLLAGCGLPQRLREKGIEVVETHLGALAAEWSGREVAHPDFPAGDMETQEILAVYRAKLALDGNATANETGVANATRAVENNAGLERREILLAVRQYLRAKAEQAEFGISGVSAVIAEHGSIVLGEDPGHVRAVSNLPPIHIAIVDPHQIVPTLDDAVHLLRSQAIDHWGRDIQTYLSIISGPSRTADIEFKMVNGVHGPKKVFIILMTGTRTLGFNSDILKNS